MKVRLVEMVPGWTDYGIVAEGAATDAPEIGEPFTVLMVHLDRLVVTASVVQIGAGWFATVDGCWYVWQAIAERRPVGLS
jgi:hypothetical protein